MQKHRPLTICKQDWLTMHISDVWNDLKIAVNPLINQNIAFPMSESSDSYADCKSSCGLIQKMCLVEPSWFHLRRSSPYPSWSSSPCAGPLPASAGSGSRRLPVARRCCGWSLRRCVVVEICYDMLWDIAVVKYCKDTLTSLQNK